MRAVAVAVVFVLDVVDVTTAVAVDVCTALLCWLAAVWAIKLGDRFGTYPPDAAAEVAAADADAADVLYCWC